MLTCDRRLGTRIPFEAFLTQYANDRPSRALAVNLSDTGIFVQTAKSRGKSQYDQPVGSHVGLEIALPGSAETIWACGRICSRKADGMVVGTGIRFTAIARAHARQIRDFCAETRRAELTRLLDRIRA